MKYQFEKELFVPLKKHFKELGYKVYAEVPCHYRVVDFVAVKGNEQIAVEMKLHFNVHVFRQASSNTMFFDKSYIATPVKPKEESEVMGYCWNYGIGILQVLPLGNIFYAKEAEQSKDKREIYDFDGFDELDTDEAGLKTMKGKSMAFVVLARIKKYVEAHPQANWDEIYKNVQSHYASKASMRSAMTSWKGFSLPPRP